MNIEKIKNYNQVMLAVITSIGVLFGIIGLIVFLFYILSDVFRIFDQKTNYQDTSLPVEEYVYPQTEGGSDKLVFSFEFPELIDTPNQLHVIPVGLRSSNELSDEYPNKLTDTESDSYGGYSRGYKNYNYYNKTFANMLVYDAKSGHSEPIFKQRVILRKFGNRNYSDDVLIYLEAVTNDSNKDGRLSFEDESSLFVYSTRTKSLRHLHYENKSLLYFEFIPNTKDIIARFGANLYKRASNPQQSVPGILCKYSFEQDKMVEITDAKLDKALKGIQEKK
jgi:hypothetical protein